MSKSKKAIESQHLFSPAKLNFRAEEKRLREMGATEADFEVVLRVLLENLLASLFRTSMLCARNVCIYLSYRFLEPQTTFEKIAHEFDLVGIRQIVIKQDRLLNKKGRRSAFKRDLYYQVMERVLERNDN